MEHESIVWPKSADDIIRYSALVYQKGLVSAAGGNVSARLGGDMLITGSNVPLRAVTYEGLVLCDAEGHVKRAAQGLKPSKETRFHLDVYRLRPEINYIIHAHPTYSVLWTLQKKPLPLYTESAKLKLGEVPHRARPGTRFHRAGRCRGRNGGQRIGRHKGFPDGRPRHPRYGQDHGRVLRPGRAVGRYGQDRVPAAAGLPPLKL